MTRFSRKVAIGILLLVVLLTGAVFPAFAEGLPQFPLIPELEGLEIDASVLEALTANPPPDVEGLEVDASMFEALPLDSTPNPEGLDLIVKQTESDDSTASSHAGTVERVKYTTSDGSVKVATVYLPYGYEDSDESYNVLYLLHGSNGSIKSFLKPNEITAFQKELDQMIESGELAPMIVVAPTYYSSDGNEAILPLSEQVEIVSDFPHELVADIIPSVEGQYRTYAETVDMDGIRASRDHRAVGGFSLGGTATWYVLLQEMQAFRYYLPMCEASWDDGEGGLTGILDGSLSAQVIHDAVVAQGYTGEDFFLYAATGTDDAAFHYLSQQMVAMLQYSDTFLPGENMTYCVSIGGEHSLTDAQAYVFRGLAKFWKDA